MEAQLKALLKSPSTSWHFRIVKMAPPYEIGFVKPQNGTFLLEGTLIFIPHDADRCSSLGHVISDFSACLTAALEI